MFILNPTKYRNDNLNLKFVDNLKKKLTYRPATAIWRGVSLQGYLNTGVKFSTLGVVRGPQQVGFNFNISIGVNLIPISHQPVLNLTPRNTKLTPTGVKTNTNLVWTSHLTTPRVLNLTINTRVLAMPGDNVLTV